MNKERVFIKHNRTEGLHEEIKQNFKENLFLQQQTSQIMLFPFKKQLSFNYPAILFYFRFNGNQLRIYTPALLS